jgi:regulator of telomere elongation helicase 1
MVYNIRGVAVEFPHNAYDCQLVYMEKVIQAIQERRNALLESPTGTGKTLCLLCSTLAWRQSYIEQMKSSLTQHVDDNSTPQGGQSSQSSFGIAFNAPRIIYASRTHSQLAQVVKELKCTSYKPKTCILGSRSQMCIHPTVSNVRGKAQDYMCRSLVSGHRCGFHNNVSDYKTNSEFTEQVCDIEDMVNLGQRYEVCPYYLSKELQSSADVIFMPYNYLIDPAIRRSLNINLQDAILVFDEAHNLEGICGEAASFDITAGDLAACVREVQRAIDITHKPGYAGEVTADDLATLKAILLKLEEIIDGCPLTNDGYTREGPFIYECWGTSISPSRRKILL